MVKSESLEGRWCFKHAILWINQEYNTVLIIYIQIACFYDLILFFVVVAVSRYTNLLHT